jgi:hypothetical protein
MNLRDALIQQAPSLALQRAAADEIARLDSIVRSIPQTIETMELDELNEQEAIAENFLEYIRIVRESRQARLSGNIALALRYETAIEWHYNKLPEYLKW